MKVAIVHDYLISFGGAERVLLALHEIYPDAPIYVLIDRKEKLGFFADKFKNIKIVQTWFGRLPLADKLISPLRFLIPMIWDSFDLSNYDLIISSASWAVTKGFNKKSGAKEICYCHTPPRFLYGYNSSRKFTGILGKLVKVYGKIINGFMRQYDFGRAQKVDYFIANSNEVKRRISEFYHKDSTVIYPPVDIGGFDQLKINKGNFYLAGGRLTAAKNFDLIIKTFNKLGLPLLVYGTGPSENDLRSIAKENVKFLGSLEDGEIKKLYGNCKAYIVAEESEDFGITPVEAMSQGTPVIAYKGGGYLETIIEGKTGIFFDKLTVENLSSAVRKMEKVKFNSEDSVDQAKKFSSSQFKKEITEFINKHAGTS
jgi:glycosyltransferase involved in cell wall biosynthesis